ncbi:hypothetical protein [Hymenobacter psychrophilus]|uniref:DUF5683 domain-containing protein n=1 Tax=Hymenobacter psychrophilus TaxID=651662 RepID=A0A1H3EMI4_9BACT|nr:hypothetical protein [Hymenobacter psychrophilus]SDX79164.1 hypothetical protein SAMN04488069_103187 [Hymenobacter psychrophilus]
MIYHRSSVCSCALRVFGHALLVVLCWAGLGQQAQAQQVPTTAGAIRLSPEDQQRGLNGVQKNFYFTLAQRPTEADYQNAGFFGQRLRPYLAGEPDALAALNRYRRQKTLFLAERVIFVGTVGLYGQQVLSAPDRQQYFNNTQKVAIGVAAASLLSNIFVSRNTNTHFQRAVEAHNAGRTASGTSLLQQLRPTSVGLAASATGRPMLALGWQL